MSALQPLRQPGFNGLGHQVANMLRQAIVAGEFAPGTRLIEADLADRLRVSRGPIRDALRQLADEGLVRVGNRISTVVPPDIEDVRELYSLRTLLECFALELAASRLSDKDLDEAEHVLAEASAAAAAGRFDESIEKDLRFHALFYERSGHRRLQRIWETLEPTFRVLIGVTNTINPWAGANEAGHRAIVEAMRRRDMEGAQSALRNLLALAESTMERELARVRSGQGAA
jgi:DNA-binding GntR family transcriptional regulator